MVGKFSAALRDHGRERASGIVLGMPVEGYNVFKNPVALDLVLDQFLEEEAGIPAVKDVADIEDDGAFNYQPWRALNLRLVLLIT
jgi:hypothetical protein